MLFIRLFLNLDPMLLAIIFVAMFIVPKFAINYYKEKKAISKERKIQKQLKKH